MKKIAIGVGAGFVFAGVAVAIVIAMSRRVAQSAEPPRPPKHRVTINAPKASQNQHQEVAWLEPVRQAIYASEPERALFFLDRYDSEFHGQGDETEEAMFMRIQATCQLSNFAEARKLVLGFNARYPRSAYGAAATRCIDRKPQ